MSQSEANSKELKEVISVLRLAQDNPQFERSQYNQIAWDEFNDIKVKKIGSHSFLFFFKQNSIFHFSLNSIFFLKKEFLNDERIQKIQSVDYRVEGMKGGAKAKLAECTDEKCKREHIQGLHVKAEIPEQLKQLSGTCPLTAHHVDVYCRVCDILICQSSDIVRINNNSFWTARTYNTRVGEMDSNPFKREMIHTLHCKKCGVPIGHTYPKFKGDLSLTGFMGRFTKLFYDHLDLKCYVLFVKPAKPFTAVESALGAHTLAPTPPQTKKDIEEGPTKATFEESELKKDFTPTWFNQKGEVKLQKKKKN